MNKITEDFIQDELNETKELLNNFVDIVSKAAPLAWVHFENSEQARSWEIEAAKLLEKVKNDE